MDKGSKRCSDDSIEFFNLHLMKDKYVCNLRNNSRSSLFVPNWQITRSQWRADVIRDMKDREPRPNMSGFKLNKGLGIPAHAEI